MYFASPSASPPPLKFDVTPTSSGSPLGAKLPSTRQEPRRGNLTYFTR